jgi:hypothetical protein
VVVLYFACLLLGVAGFLTAFVGFADQRVVDRMYTVGFGRPGDECGGGAVAFDVTDGHPLGCARSPAGAVASVRFPGFTDEQNSAVQQLARAREELSGQDQADIQALVDQFSAGVPEDVQLEYAHVARLGPLWGRGLAAPGIAALLAAVVLYLWLRRRV